MRFCTRGCPKTVISTKLPEFTMSTVSRTWFIHSNSGITARSEPKQENRLRGGGRVQGQEGLDLKEMWSGEFGKDLGALPRQAPL